MAQEYYNGFLINKSSSNGYPTIFVGGRNVLLHRYIWEEKNGLIPNGMVIHHKDGNKLNFKIDNLILLSSKEHHRYHAIQHNLGKSNKGKKKKHASGFCGIARKIKAIKNDKVLMFDSIADATRHFAFSGSTIQRILSGKRKAAYGWRFEYVNG